MGKITLEYSRLLDWEISTYQERVKECHTMLHQGTGLGNDYLGWIDIPNNYDKKEFERIKEAANRIRNQSEVFIIIGIGGSYLGSRAAIEMLNGTFYNELSDNKRNGPKIYYAGHNISSFYLKDLFEIIDGKDISINVISKSGTTTEPAIVFRIFKEYMENKYGNIEASKRIYVTTDKNKGALKKLAEKEGYETFIIPEDVGGRYSVLTPVGLLPMSVAGIDIDEVIKGGQAATKDLSSDDLNYNHAYKYAVIRNLLYSKGKTIEILVGYEPNLFYFGEWYKQLFGESEGKNGKGIFPTYLNYTTDLHSMGQYVQDGMKNIFETILNVGKFEYKIEINEDKDNLDVYLVK